ncbi:hypothetical protein BESB_061680 [Besnoitia besnoiti]|uniref:Ribosomal protein/NADH dehydrogenase domain-containing protein n=1 Tax=Besnoitia besnoiti TaxID=94643 RepID=A0A2A9MG82_BESBE|nr:hypothetical protein BESB_061680 [Besnoitia besnoiti]PFH35281.1 hypothetical protein BESB_061680 [Besnoitia besnoiti]
MSARRLERLVLGGGGGFQNIKGIEFLLHKPLKENAIVKDFCAFFLPAMRYQNPALSVQILEAPDSASSSSASPAIAAASKPTTARTGAQPARGRSDRLRLFFGEGNGTHMMNLSLYRSPHQLMQRLVDVDSQWQQLQAYAASAEKQNSGS